MTRYVLSVLIVILFALQGYCQENQASDNQGAFQVANDAASPAQATGGETAKAQEISIYGEIKSVDTAAGSIVVQYYDYDSDDEKSVEVTAGNNTKMEGALTINDIKQGNWADIDYTVIGGKNIAKSIAVEKEENTTTEAPES